MKKSTVVRICFATALALLALAGFAAGLPLMAWGPVANLALCVGLDLI